MKIIWNLRVMMAQHDIRSATELARQLDARGVEISTAQVTRIVNKMPDRISVTVLRGLMEIFHCYPNDLIVVEHDEPENSNAPVSRIHADKGAAIPTAKPKTRQKNTEPREVDNVLSLTGGKARPMPVKGQ
ncbi:XRE family transcriptional regulator [Mariprofundus sp. EBB-1]|uniref:helix-turn-helix domain-containing protein n=1 Tax=Mariprofundus sp. EBB-1 TaxID=2650971 RepID=UPI000EF1F718|nr:helix-turn-helix transcriptional regulator [Mariprofundus sp. EBB-1]RLL51719.1 XRE family transcriptional regulator [Mariprofundus sp. EBB-1]